MQSSHEQAVIDFDRDVLHASRERPVLVDFWAAWCGPCRVLGPVLEKLDAEAGNAWTLVKIDTEANPEIAAHMGIRGIPAVKLFVDGGVVAEFTGALPEAAVRRWLDEHLPSPQREQFARAEALLAEGDEAEARALLESVLRDAPDDEATRALLARLLVFDEPERAADFVNGLYTPEADAVRTLARFLVLPDDPTALDDAPVRTDYLAAASTLRDGDADAALDRLIAIVQRDRSFDDDGARKAAVALFVLLGDEDPVVQRHRPVFNRSLY
ncbi:MAG: tetratricopeptide repeat protein [Rhodothermales bacterium]